jgi:hypothetical protein
MNSALTFDAAYFRKPELYNKSADPDEIFSCIHSVIYEKPLFMNSIIFRF